MASRQAGGGANPYRRGARTGGTQGQGRQRPETELGKRRGTRIRDMGSTIIPDQSILQEVDAKVLELTVSDLEDLADELSGVDSYNPKVKTLRAQDLQDIEAIFYEPKMRAFKGRGQAAGGEVEPEIFDNWSCCCCTPCCCCAATETDPFADRVLEEI